MGYEKSILELLAISDKYEKYKALWSAFMNAVDLSLNEDLLAYSSRFHLNKKIIVPKCNNVSEVLRTIDFAGSTLFVRFHYNHKADTGVIAIGYLNDLGEKVFVRSMYFDEIGTIKDESDDKLIKCNIVHDTDAVLGVFYSFLIEAYVEYAENNI